MREIKYEDLMLHQKICIKGMIRNEEYRNNFIPFKHDSTDLELLDCMWMLSNFKEAVQHFLNKYANHYTYNK